MFHYKTVRVMTLTCDELLAVGREGLGREVETGRRVELHLRERRNPPLRGTARARACGASHRGGPAMNNHLGVRVCGMYQKVRDLVSVFAVDAAHARYHRSLCGTRRTLSQMFHLTVTRRRRAG